MSQDTKKDKKQDKSNLVGNVANRMIQDQMMNVLVSAIPGGPILNIMQKGALEATSKKLIKSAALETAQELTNDGSEEEETIDALGRKILMNRRIND